MDTNPASPPDSPSISRAHARKPHSLQIESSELRNSQSGRKTPLSRLNPLTATQCNAVPGSRGSVGGSNSRPPSAGSAFKLAPLGCQHLPETCRKLGENSTPNSPTTTNANVWEDDDADSLCQQFKCSPFVSGVSALKRTSSSTRLRQKQDASGDVSLVKDRSSSPRLTVRAMKNDEFLGSDMSTADSLGTPTVAGTADQASFGTAYAGATHAADEPTTPASMLLRRRLLTPLGIRTQPSNQTSGLASVLLAASRRRDITRLADGEKIYDRYQWNRVLQEQGEGGKVVVCQRKNSPEDDHKSFVLKMRAKSSLKERTTSEQYRKAQYCVLNIPPHPGVMPIREVLEDEQFYYIVMPMAKNGPLLPALLEEFPNGVMPARAVRKVMKDIFEALGHLHRFGILHRDVKPDNLVIHDVDDLASPVSRTRNYKVALIDFDHADPDWDPCTINPKRQSRRCGTLHFNAPETFLGIYSQSSDLYSAGVILYMLMIGNMPYDSALFDQAKGIDCCCSQSPHGTRRKCQGECEDLHIHQAMKNAKIDWDCEPWASQRLCSEFCQCLLAFDRQTRFHSSEDVLNHDWFRE